MVLQQKQKSGWSLRRSRHHHGNLAVKHVHHKNAKTFSVSCSNRESQDATSRTYANYLQKKLLFQICLNGSFNLSSPLLPGGTAEEYLQILGQLLTSCLESCQPSHVPVSEINIAPQIGMLGNPTYPGFMVMKYPTDLSGRQSNIQTDFNQKKGRR